VIALTFTMTRGSLLRLGKLQDKMLVPIMGALPNMPRFAEPEAPPLPKGG